MGLNCWNGWKSPLKGVLSFEGAGTRGGAAIGSRRDGQAGIGCILGWSPNIYNPEVSRIGFCLGGRTRVAEWVVTYSYLRGWAECLFWGTGLRVTVGSYQRAGQDPEGSESSLPFLVYSRRRL